MAFPLKVGINHMLSQDYVEPLLIFDFELLSHAKITRWWEEEVRGNLFFCFDGCAQYLSSPTAPHLISRAYEGSAPPILVACLRNPVDQALSWWRYENNAMVWGESMGLEGWNAVIRSKLYPPKTIASAIEFAKSDFVQNMRLDAESFVRNVGQQYNGNTADATATRPLSKNITGNIRCMRLPSWAITWPGGQLSTIGTSGNYPANIDRYNKVFTTTEDKCCHSTTGKRKMGVVHTVLLECQSGKKIKSAIEPFLSDVVLRCAKRRKVAFATLMSSMEVAIERVAQDVYETHRNSSALLDLEFEASEEDYAILCKHFETETDWYSGLLHLI